MSFGEFDSHDEQGLDVGSSSASVKSSQTSRLPSYHMPAFSWTAAITERRPLELEHVSPLSKVFVNKEEEQEERTPNVNIRALREIFVLCLLGHENSIRRLLRWLM
jgi:hypothetical protein